MITETQIGQAIQTIKTKPQVRDAAISQKGNTLSLSVIVGHATNETYAKELGESFIRMVDGEVSDRFNYLVVVATPLEKVLAEGAMAKSARSVSW